MRTIHAGWTAPLCGRREFLRIGGGLAVAGFLTWAGPRVRARAVPTDSGARRDNTDKGRIEFRMENKTWKEVFDWLKEQTGVPVVVPIHPTGTFTFVGPRAARYSLPQIVDLINQELRKLHEMVLIRRPRCFIVVAVEDVNATGKILPEKP
ncbi:MAG TPA: hypothetical protein VKD72_03840 [Gemmataceae bacterium]|nr:hypothetical protein [Gemmataceae bacterium]